MLFRLRGESGVVPDRDRITLSASGRGVAGHADQGAGELVGAQVGHGRSRVIPAARFSLLGANRTLQGSASHSCPPCRGRS
ncbi:hypothetical protein GCM10010357_18840 [Streptomyces luteireticuli]|uniref:Uncharacterized protein n=1 Tax=Streptomyces luteireticuli TaxID=173858 RepID=A0ABN0YJS6_9ACTN